MSDRSQEVVDALGLEGAQRRRRRWWPIAAAIAIVALAAGTYALRQHRTAAPQFVTDSVRQGALLVTVTATGTLQPTNQVDVGSEVSGIIDRVLVDFNATVKAGQVLAELDTQQLDARVASANAALAVAQASLVQAQATVVETAAKVARSRDLASKNIASQQSLETDDAAAQRAVAAVASAKAQVTSAQASLKDAQTALAKAAIRSPIDGIVIAREVDPGQTVAASFQAPVLFKVAEDLRRMELHLDIDESDIGQVHAGQHAQFRVDAYPGKAFEAEITSGTLRPAHREQRRDLRDRAVGRESGPAAASRHDGDRRRADRAERQRAARAESRAALPTARAGRRRAPRRTTRRASGWSATAARRRSP